MALRKRERYFVQTDSFHMKIKNCDLQQIGFLNILGGREPNPSKYVHGCRYLTMKLKNVLTTLCSFSKY